MEKHQKCEYGCGKEALFYFEKAQKHCCADHYRKCPHQAAVIGAKRRGKKHSDATKALIGVKSKQRLAENGGSYFKGKNHTDETKRCISEKNKGKPSWSKGLTADTDERIAQRVEFSRTHPELYANTGEANGMFGKTHTDEVKQRLSEHNKQTGRWSGENNPWYGVDRSGSNSPRYLSDDLRRAWKTYKSLVRYWSECVYNQHQQTINPSNLPRGIREYHLDHIVPIWYGFVNNIDPELLSKKENLRMLYYVDNLRRDKQTLDEHATDVLQKLLQL